MENFLHGFIIGIAIVAPIGPLALIIINKNIKKGFFSGFISGLGVSFADLCFATVVILGLSSLIDIITGLEKYLRFGGGVLLIIYGIYLIKSKISDFKVEIKVSKKGLFSDFFFTFVYTILNPVSLLIFTSVFPSVINYSANQFNTIIFLGGIFSGSVSWWVFLNSVVQKAKSKISVKFLQKINTASAIFLLILGLFFTVRFF